MRRASPRKETELLTLLADAVGRLETSFNRHAGAAKSQKESNSGRKRSERPALNAVILDECEQVVAIAEEMRTLRAITNETAMLLTIVSRTIGAVEVAVSNPRARARRLRTK